MLSAWRPTEHRNWRMWKWQVMGHFTVRSYYAFLVNRGISLPVKHLWTVKAPLKVQIFMWLLIKVDLIL